MLDFKNERKRIYATIREHLEALLISKGFAWTKDNFWVADGNWVLRTCSLGAFKRNGLFVELVGGASLYLHEYHMTLVPDSEGPSSHAATLGGPLHWIDKRLDFDSGRFTTWAEFERWLPTYRRAFEECVIPEFDRYPNEAVLLDALLQPDWLQSVKLSATQDRRGALVTLMLAKRDGKDAALAWARADIERIRTQEPGEDRPVRWQELHRAIAHLTSARIG